MRMFRRLKGFAVGLLAGALLMTVVPSFAETVQQYVLVQASYPIQVNGVKYVSEEQPVLNYEGHTYIPLRAVGDLLGAGVTWNSELRQAEIVFGDGVGTEDPGDSNDAFRRIVVNGSGGNYRVTGEARVFEAVMSYAVRVDDQYIIEEHLQLDEGAPSWSSFEIQIDLTAGQLPETGDVIVEIYQMSAKDGSKVNVLNVPLESFGQS